VFDLIRKIWQVKTVTKTSILDEAPSRYRGKPVFTTNECTGCESCVTSCPSGAIDFQKSGETMTLSISYADCIFCGACAESCETKMIQVTNEYRLATKNKNNLMISVNRSVKEPTLLSTGNGG
jgi:formate hydrogenlyase subunit 6/NADH:ubiquinone oxidoreductase subunit I